MNGFEVKFNVYANSQDEADLVSEAVKQFITNSARKGVAVTANKLTETINRWKDNFFVINYFK